MFLRLSRSVRVLMCADMHVLPVTCCISTGRILEIFKKRPSGKLGTSPEVHLKLTMFYRWVGLYCGRLQGSEYSGLLHVGVALTMMAHP